MKCFRCFSFALFALLGVFFGSFILNQSDTYALDDVTVTIHASESVSQWSNIFPTCTDTCLDNYRYLIVNGAPFNNSSGYSIRLYMRYDGSHAMVKVMSGDMSFAIYELPFNGSPNNYLQWGTSSTFENDVTLTLTTNYQSGIVPSGSIELTENGTYDVSQYAEAVVNVPETDCPPSSGGGGNYHDDLVAINNSIIICAATCLVIYFFYCIYRMIIKNSGVK